ncbi:hypothetical protein [Aestuariivita boseongensis]|uniref:hypothetical protein n=1 Tax=Aestuariivita boseongensis TaxID=1470562 RepID=UPI000682080E|nr:hypothetical protein [Aestuariivita boseongensis]
MNIMVYVLPLVCAAIGFYLSTQLGLRGRIRPVGVMVLVSAGLFWLCIELGQGSTGWDGIGYVILALFVVVPFAIGLIFGLIFGLLRRRRAKAAHD